MSLHLYSTIYKENGPLRGENRVIGVAGQFFFLKIPGNFAYVQIKEIHHLVFLRGIQLC